MDRLRKALSDRFDSDVSEPSERSTIDEHEDRLLELASRRSHRRFEDRPVSLDLLKLLAGVALAAPSKSDLQQRDIIIVRDADQLAALKTLVADQAWTQQIPALLVFCGNNRRQRQIHDVHERTFANDHLDAFFNAAVDGGIALQAFITAAETIGLGCCPISAIRNQPDAASEILNLPDYTFPIAGLAVGWPSTDGYLSLRLPLETTVHVDRFDDSNVMSEIAAYDRRRAELQPFRTQRAPERFGTAPGDTYTWSDDKTRQYALPERSDFGAYIVKRRFILN